MHTLRTIGLVFFAVATLFGLIATFTPTGEAMGSTSGALGPTTITETYRLWGIDAERDPTNAPAVTTTTGWMDSAMDGTAGISYLRAGPVLLAIALVAGLVALILTVAPATTHTIAGGAVGIGAVVTGVLGFILHGAGLVLRVEGFLGSPEFLALRYATALIVLMLIAAFVATLLGMRGASPATADTTAGRQPMVTGTRRLRCPKCSTVNETRLGILPTCGQCGYSS